MLSTSILQNVKWNHTYEIHALCHDYGTVGESKGSLFYMLWSEAHWAGFGFFCVVAEGRDQVRPRPVDLGVSICLWWKVLIGYILWGHT